MSRKEIERQRKAFFVRFTRLGVEAFSAASLLGHSEKYKLISMQFYNFCMIQDFM